MREKKERRKIDGEREKFCVVFVIDFVFVVGLFNGFLRERKEKVLIILK